MLRYRAAAAAIILSLVLSGCAGTKFGNFIQAATTSINNPVSTTDIYRIKNTYAATLALAAEYRRYCWSAPYQTLMADPVAGPLCKQRRAVARTASRSSAIAGNAIEKAQTFIASHPTINAAQVIDAAWQAVTDFKNAIPAVN